MSSVLVLSVLLSWAQTPSSAPATAPASRPATSQPAVFQEGVRIDWRGRKVELDAEVVLREGPLELFACSRNTREYESIVRIDARPLHVYQALGLIGLTPGHPIRLNPRTQKVESATGDRVEVTIRYVQDGALREEPLENWLQQSRSGLPVDGLHWVFAGSIPSEGGGIGADAEGTVIALVDFATAVIALPERRSDRNDELWVEPATARIPAIGTQCTLILQRGPIRIGLDAAGRVLLDGHPAPMSAVARAVRGAEPETLRIRVRVHPGCPAQEERALMRFLRDLQVPEAAIETTRPAAAAPMQNDGRAMASWIQSRLQQRGTADEKSLSDSTQRFADDLRQRTANLERRTAEVTTYVEHLAEDFRRLVSASPRDTPGRTGRR